MPRPHNQDSLLKASLLQFNQLIDMIENMSNQEQLETFCFNRKVQGKEAHWNRDQNIRDVLIHLYEWHMLLLKWVDSNIQGNTQPFLPHPYNWKTYGQLNIQYWQKHQSTVFNKALSLFKQSHHDIMQMIESLSSDALFTKDYYPWVGGSMLGQYFVSTTSSHYVWAMEKIKVNQKAKTSLHL